MYSTQTSETDLSVSSVQMKNKNAIEEKPTTMRQFKANIIIVTISNVRIPKLRARIQARIRDLQKKNKKLKTFTAQNDNSSQNIFFSKFSDGLRKHVDMQIVIGGDFNCALAPLDKTGGTSTETKDSN